MSGWGWAAVIFGGAVIALAWFVPMLLGVNFARAVLLGGSVQVFVLTVASFWGDT